MFWGPAKQIHAADLNFIDVYNFETLGMKEVSYKLVIPRNKKNGISLHF
jgi:hypothetical protein